MSEARKCDVCEGYYESAPDGASLKVRGYSYSSRIDICSTCCETLKLLKLKDGGDGWQREEAVIRVLRYALECKADEVQEEEK